jgi:hypothetical protein
VAISLSNDATFVDEKGGPESKKARAGGSTRAKIRALGFEWARNIELGGAIAVPKKRAPPKGVIQRVTRVRQYFTRA